MANYTLNYSGAEVDKLLEKIDTAFGEKTVMGDTLTWDGDISGKPVVSLDRGDGVIMTFCKLSEAVPTIEDLSNGISATVAGMGTNEITPEMITTGNGYIFANMLVIISEPNSVVGEVGATFAETGTYLMQQSLGEQTMYVTALTINNYTGFERTEVKPLDIKYLPESHQFGETTVTTETALFEEFKCDGQVSGWYSEHNFPDDFKLAIFDTEKSYKLIVNGDEYFGNYREQDSYINFENIMVGESAFTIQVYSNGNTTGVASVNIHRDEGCLDPSYDFTLSLYEITTKKIVRKLSKKYLPDNIGGGGVCVTVDFMTGKASMTSTEIATALSNGNYVFSFMEVEEGLFTVARVVAVTEIGEGFGLAAVLMLEMIDMDGGGMMQTPVIITEDGSFTMMS